jgi:hypothetical protein
LLIHPMETGVGTHLGECPVCAVVGYTLVLLGALDGLGYRIAVGGGHLEIQFRAGERLALIARTMRGPYRVSHERQGGYGVEVVSDMELRIGAWGTSHPQACSWRMD